MKKLSLETQNRLLINLYHVYPTGKEIEHILNIIHSDPIFNTSVNNQANETEIAISPVKIKPSELYKNMSIDDLIKEYQKLVILYDLCTCRTKIELIRILMREVKKYLKLRTDSMLEQIDFD